MIHHHGGFGFGFCKRLRYKPAAMAKRPKLILWGGYFGDDNTPLRLEEIVLFLGIQYPGVAVLAQNLDRVWLPNAWVNPGVTIGANVVVAARSLIHRPLTRS